MAPGSRGRGRHVAGAVAAAVVLAGCELQEVTVAVPEDLVVVDALVQVGIGSDTGGPPSFEQPRVVVLLHRTEGSGLTTLPGARVTLNLPDGSELDVPEVTTGPTCQTARPPSGGGTCYALSLSELRPGVRLALTIETDRGERLFGVTEVPDAFELRVPEPTCVLMPDTTLELVWTRAEGAWAYIGETEIFGLAEALAGAGIPVALDPLPLLGLSISASDTTLLFPAEFGVFDRADLDRDLAVYLQGGLPDGTAAWITVAAVDRNYVNWVRGGNFNPSGMVRVPSMAGDGTGFFGSGVFRRLQVLVPVEGASVDGPSCLDPPAAPGGVP